jgi:uncharacterized membrane protein YuzA (DUF378 family)
MAGREWYVKKEHAWARILIYSVVGMAALVGLLIFLGTFGK